MLTEAERITHIFQAIFQTNSATFKRVKLSDNYIYDGVEVDVRVDQ